MWESGEDSVLGFPPRFIWPNITELKYLHFVQLHQAYNVACYGSELQSDAATEAK